MIHVCIGTEPRQRIAQQVLQYSIQSRTSEPVEFHLLPNESLGLNQQLTGFSFNRWMVPENRSFSGRAIYMDADIVVLDDIALLWSYPMGKAPILARRRDALSRYTSVMLMDCDRLTGLNFTALVGEVAIGRADYNSIMWATEKSPVSSMFGFGDLPSRWNDLDIRKADTAAIHFTGLHRQPWKYSGHPFGHVFQTELKAALKDGYVQRTELAKAISDSYVRADVLDNP